MSTVDKMEDDHQFEGNVPNRKVSRDLINIIKPFMLLKSLKSGLKKVTFFVIFRGFFLFCY